MGKTKIKICGLFRPEDIMYVNEALPDLAGFVFWEKSKRFVTPQKAGELRQTLDRRIRSVGVFVDEDINFVAKLIKSGIIDVAQLHGSENDDYIRRLMELTDAVVIKAFKVRSGADLDRARRSSAHIVLLDAGMGEGKRFDWELITGFDRDYFLAGGIDPENAAEAVRRLAPYGIDTSTGVESGGCKDREKIRALVDTIRAAE